MDFFQIVSDFFKSDNETLQVIKGIVATVGFTTLFLRINTIFSSYKSKQSVKTDLEILSLIKGNPEKYNLISERINEDLIKIYAIGGRKNAIVSLIIGLIFFVGFGAWTVNIFESNQGFSPWMILTALFTMTGISMMIAGNPKINDQDEFLRIHFYQKSYLLIGVIVGIICTISMLAMYSSQKDYSFFAYFIFTAIAIIGYSVLLRCISIRRIRTIKKLKV